MANSAARFFARQDQQQMERRKLYDARYAIERFRTNGNASGFPELDAWLNRHGSRMFSLGLSGFGREDTWGLTEEEYGRMKAAYESSLAVTAATDEDHN